MPVIKWQSAYACGLPDIDRQHQQLVRMLNSVYEAIRSGKAARTLPFIVDELIDYTLKHFSHEEGLMRGAGYPLLTGHQQQHRQLESTVQLTRERLAAGEPGMAMEIYTFLRRWLLHHIVENDLPAGRFILEQDYD